LKIKGWNETKEGPQQRRRKTQKLARKGGGLFKQKPPGALRKSAGERRGCMPKEG